MQRLSIRSCFFHPDTTKQTFVVTMRSTVNAVYYDPHFVFLVKWQPLVTVVIIRAAKEVFN